MAGAKYEVIADGLTRKLTPAATIDLSSELKKEEMQYLKRYVLPAGQ